MECSGCGNKAAVRIRAGFFTNERKEREPFEVCNRCGETAGGGLADVFWDGSPEHGLPDDPRTGMPRVFGSKAEKARFLKENHLREAGDRVHGSPIRHSSGMEDREDPVKSRESVNIALARVREMGADYRRQEYLRIKKASGNFVEAT